MIRPLVLAAAIVAVLAQPAQACHPDEVGGSSGSDAGHQGCGPPGEGPGAEGGGGTIGGDTGASSGSGTVSGEEATQSTHRSAPRIRGLRTTTPVACMQRTSRCRRPGARFYFRLSERARLAVRVERVEDDQVMGRLRFAGRRGLNRLTLRGRVAPGLYRVVIVATDSAGNASRPASVRFRIRAS